MPDTLKREGHCPICDCDDLEYGNIELDGTDLFYDWHCPKCDSEGTEVYSRIFIKHEVYRDGRKE